MSKQCPQPGITGDQRRAGLLLAQHIQKQAQLAESHNGLSYIPMADYDIRLILILLRGIGAETDESAIRLAGNCARHFANCVRSWQSIARERRSVADTLALAGDDAGAWNRAADEAQGMATAWQSAVDYMQDAKTRAQRNLQTISTQE